MKTCEPHIQTSTTAAMAHLWSVWPEWPKWHPQRYSTANKEQRPIGEQDPLGAAVIAATPRGALAVSKAGPL